MRFKLASYRSERRAVMWLLDPLGALIVVMVAGGWLLFGSDRVPAWIVGLVVVVPSTWLLRLRIDRDQPALVRATILWCFIPVKKRSGPVDTLASGHSDDFTAATTDPHDEVTVGGWSFDCRHAERVVSWLRESAAELATPRAEAKP